VSLPELFTTAGERSFARRSISERHSATLLETLELNAVREPYRTRLLDFRAESLGGRLSDPFKVRDWDPALFEPRELADWRQALDPLLGRSWYDLPWCFAESFYFLRMLFAFGYYEPAGPNRLRDPFEPFKRRELTQPGGGLEAARELAPLLAERDGPSGPAVRELLLASLWGNRMDLSMHSVAREYRGDFRRGHELLVDHSLPTVDRLLAARRVGVILDNAGPELVCDLLLTARLLGEPEGAGAQPAVRGGPRHVVLHAKRSPFYVSDARPADVRATIQALAGSGTRQVGAAGSLLAGALAEGRLRIQDHWFWNGPRFFQDLPADLRSELGSADLVLIKGDANYRRLVGDRRWPVSTPMEGLTGYFPAPFAVLRTMKSEIVVDLSEAQVLRLDGEDAEWRTNGRRGIVRFRQ
jgi:uncharacterized protein with ATP-grasp and redox domains